MKSRGGPGFVGEHVPGFGWDDIGLGFQLAPIVAGDCDRLPHIKFVFKVVEAGDRGGVEVEVEETRDRGGLRV